jgi:hypothetical protein
MLEKIDKQIMHSVAGAFDTLIAADNHEFGELIEGLGREAVLIRIGEGAPVPDDFEKAVDCAAREVVEAFNALEHAYRQRF